MNFIKKAFTSVIFPASFIYLIITLLTTAVATYGYTEFAPSIKALGIYFAFAFVLSLLNLIFKTDKLNLFVKFVIHYFGLMLEFFVIYFIMMKNNSKVNGAIILGIIITIMYVICAAIASIFIILNGKKENTEKKYQSQFGK